MKEETAKDNTKEEIAKGLIMFGNYLLSRQRQKSTKKLNSRRVNRQDLINFSLLMANK